MHNKATCIVVHQVPFGHVFYHMCYERSRGNKCLRSMFACTRQRNCRLAARVVTLAKHDELSKFLMIMANANTVTDLIIASLHLN